MKLIEITMTAYKHFYVEAESEEDALNSDTVEEERAFSGFQDADWEHEETTASEVSAEEAESLRKRHPEWILKDEE